MSKLLLLGGSHQQIIAIETAKKLGYETVLCDYLKDNPGQEYADKFYLVSTTDREAVLDVARAENIDGIVAYASDPAAPTAAYVAERLGLPGLPFDMAMNFCEKHRFRSFLRVNGFNVPASLYVDSEEPFDSAKIADFHFPLIVKPTDSSGSKGVTVVREETNIAAAIDAARGYSRNGIIIVEEFIERDHPHVIEAEITVSGGEVVIWGLINSIRDEVSNGLLPAAYSFPLEVSDVQLNVVVEQVSALVHASGMKEGSFNIEMIVDRNDRLFFLDAGPRNGGNMLPDFISMISGVDVVEATVRMAMGQVLGEGVRLAYDADRHWGLAVLHSPSDVVYRGLRYSDVAQSRLVKDAVFAQPGDAVAAFKTCTAAFGFSFFEFRDEAEKRAVMNNLSEHIGIIS